MPIELQEILEEQDAWRLALSWQNTLRGSIRLVRSYRLGRLVDSYDWVALSLDQTKPLDELLHHVYTFRAAVSVWTAISSCRGYSGRENSAFWKRVFGKLRDYGDERELLRSDAYDSRLFDALRFFDVGGEDVFPRIHLFRNDFQLEDAYKEVILVNTFFHAQDKTAAMVDIDRQYATIVKMLNPYIQRARWSRVVPVSLDISNSGLPASMRGVLDVLPTLRTNSEGEYPVFAAREVSFVSSYADNPFEVQTLKELMLHHSINVNYFTSETPTAAIALTTLASYYRLMLGIDPLVQCRIHQTTFALCDDIDLRLDCPFSALPHSRSLQFLSFWRGSLTRAQIPNEQWAWIGYAIFHPESPRSSWSGLKLDRTPVTRENIKILEAMAQGNNLRAIQLGLPPQNTAYHGAELRVGAFVHTEPKLDSEIYLVACKQITVDVCLLSEDELMTLPEWVGVIVPSYGIGWTLAANLQHFESRKASESCLKSLVCESRQPLIEDLERLLSVIGSRLRFLDICDNRMVDAVTLASYLHHCPVLESLRVCHDGSLWKHPTNNCPRLKKLALKLQPGVTYAAPSVDAAKTSFQNVQELRIETLALSEFEFNRDPLRAAFEVLDRLEYLHFACKESGAWLGNAPLTYEEARAESWECMGLQPDNEKTDVQVNGCIAFLSVLRKQRDSAMHHVDRDILDKIFEFAIARPRKIWIDSNGRPLVRRQSTAMF